MSNEPERIKGKVKQAAGDITDNDQLRKEGKLDEASANVKDRLQHAKDRVDGLVEEVKDHVQEAMHRK